MLEVAGRPGVAVLRPLRRAATFAAFVSLLGVTGALVATPVHAGLFDDDEARRAILDLRQRIDQSSEQARTRQAEQSAAIGAQIEQLRRSLLDLNNQLEQLRSDNAKLRGQNEQLARDVADLQVRQKDMQSGVDDRLRRVEPQKVAVDGREFSADPQEKRQYDEAMDSIRKGDFQASANALAAFRKRYPASGYGSSTLFWLGNAQYGLRQYREAIASFRSLVTAAPEDEKAPEALLAIANCQAELRDTKAARKTIEDLLKAYPKSEAAQAGRERIAALK